MKIIFAYLIVIFCGYFFGSVVYVNILHFTGLEHNMNFYSIFIFISMIVSYRYRISILKKLKYKTISFSKIFKKKK